MFFLADIAAEDGAISCNGAGPRVFVCGGKQAGTKCGGLLPNECDNEVDAFPDHRLAMLQGLDRIRGGVLARAPPTQQRYSTLV